MPRLFTARRMALGSVLLGSMALASGCDEGATPTTPPADAKERIDSMKNAMEKQNAPGGPAHSKTPQK